jgi:hypothetical protein
VIVILERVSEGRWTPDVWERGEAAARRLPRVEDLPLAEQGFDREAVREAFDSFYRHAAELDATLRLLESVEVFGTQARELRAEIRSLRRASWGPLPQRPVWAAGRGSSMPARTGGALPSALPRLAVEAAFIVLVAVGAALADLSVALIVLLVLAAWLIVGLAEFATSTRRATPRPGLLPAPARREEGPVAEPAPPAPAETAGQATMIEPMPVAEPAVQPEPSQVPPEAEHPPTVLQAEPTTKRRWLRRKPAAEPEPVPMAQSKHVRVLPVEPATEEPAAGADPWEREPDLRPGEIGLSEAPAPAGAPEPETANEPEAAESEQEQPEEPSAPYLPEAEADEAAGAAAQAPELELESELGGELAEGGPEPGPPEEERGRLWHRRQRDLETEPAATAEPIPEASPFEAEPPAERAVDGGETSDEEEQSPWPEVAPFQPEPEEAEHEEGAAVERAAEADPVVEAPRRRRRLWRRVRRDEAIAPEPSPPPPHVERIDVEQAIDPRRVAALWGESAFAAEPKHGDTWIQPVELGGTEPEAVAEAQAEPAPQEADKAEVEPESHGMEAPPVADVVHARSRSQVGLRRGRR